MKNKRSWFDRLTIHGHPELVEGLNFGLWFLIFNFSFFIFCQGCGGGSTAPAASPEASVSPFVSKTVVFEPTWPSDLAAASSQLNLSATLKGETTSGKSAGAIGPVAATRQETGYQFNFSEVPSEIANSGEIAVEIMWPHAGLKAECQKVASVSKKIIFSENHAVLPAMSENFDLSYDCDGDSLSNLKEFHLGLKADTADSDGDGVGDAADIFPLDAQEAKDADVDGLGDNGDNCPGSSNADQADLDGDKIGDLCDLDKDGDGLADEGEEGLGLDPRRADSDGDGSSDNIDLWPLDFSRYSDIDKDGVADDHRQDNCPTLTNAGQENQDQDDKGDICDSDMDGDGVDNDQDNCSVQANSNQMDSDGDKTGDACDCNPNDGRIFQANADDPDLNSFDSNCDGIDGDKTKAILVDATLGNDLQAAISRAITENKDVYIANGNYDLRGVSFTKGLRLYGGFSTGFAQRTFQTEWTNLSLANVPGPFLFDGISFLGASSGSATTGLVIGGGTIVTLDHSRIHGGGGQNSSLGLLIASDNAVIKNSVIDCGNGRICTGVEIQGASPLLSKNTINAATTTAFDPSVVTVYALRMENALSVTLTSNILSTQNAANRYPLYCAGLEPLDPAKISGNVLASFPSSLNNVLAVTCLGGFDFDADDGLMLGLKTASGNSDYSGSSLETLLADPVLAAVGGPR